MSICYCTTCFSDQFKKLHKSVQFLFYFFAREVSDPSIFFAYCGAKKVFLKFYRNNVRNNMRNYTAVFFGIVPIEKGQAFLPVPRVQHLIKRCKYEFLPHAMPTLRKSYLTRQPFLAVTTEFEKRFLCLLHLSLCVVK